ncbi:MAG: helix-turn-helix transcriptional regulator [Alistipes sp.]|nr:helix-turn-helix transcriptional regulator [Alistipes sp.]
MVPQIAIISANTLEAMTLRSLLSDITPGIDVVCYHNVEEFNAAAPVVAHLFVSAKVIFANMEMFRPMLKRTMVITEGDNTPFTQSGMRTIDATASESAIVRQILHIHQAGHPSGRHPHEMQHGGGVVSESTHEASPLSQREKEVLALLVKGYINKEIADKLNISLTTAIFHRNNISEKLKTRSLGRLTIYAVLNNIVSLSEI